jgi:two-component system LytT family response regulator
VGYSRRSRPLTAICVPFIENSGPFMNFPFPSGDFQDKSMRMAFPPMRTLIVDDEPIARQVLREELDGFEEVEVVGEAENGGEALLEIARLKPDLVFLDLEMPGVGGFEVIHRLPQGVLPIVVIVTAYNQHAIHAFEAGALDYLLKPVSRERLEKALDRARALRGRIPDVAESLIRLNEAGEPRSRKVVGRSGEEYYLLDLNDVLAFQAEHEIVWILTARQKYMATQALRHIEGRLHDSTFRRVHRNALVNVDHVRKMAPLSSQRWMLTLSNGHEFIVSKRQAGIVRRLLQW